MDAESCRRTREVLQGDADPLVTKPRLTDALLSRPPFRFLHDVFLAVHRTTGFMSGLLTVRELDSKAMASTAEKEERVAFLEKVITAVSEAHGTPLCVEPQKILAGLEPDRTNELLQTLARVARDYRTASESRGIAHEEPCSQGSGEEDASEALCLEEEGSEEVLSLEDDAGEVFSVEPEELAPLSVPMSRPQSARRVPPGRLARPKSARGQRSCPSSGQHAGGEMPGVNYGIPSSEDGALVRDLMAVELPNRTQFSQDASSPQKDLAQISLALQEYVLLSAQLKRSIENLMDAAQPMQKEWLHWKQKTDDCREQLRKRENSRSDSCSEAAKLQQIENEVAEKQSRIRRLKDRVARNQRTLMDMLESLSS